MNNEHVKGDLHEIKGKVKEDVGHALGKDKMAGEGVLEQVKGKIEKGLGDVKDAIKSGVDHVLHPSDKSKSA